MCKVLYYWDIVVTKAVSLCKYLPKVTVMLWKIRLKALEKLPIQYFITNAT